MTVLDPGAGPVHDGDQPSPGPSTLTRPPRPGFFYETNHRVARAPDIFEPESRSLVTPVAFQGDMLERYDGWCPGFGTCLVFHR
jgi:hypothetical protein